MPVPSRPLTAFALLGGLMAATRFGHLGGPWSPPDASWAVFFLGGFYLTCVWLWALAALMLLAVGVDLVAIRYLGVSNYCLTLAYWFIVPAYAVLWLGGAWLRQGYRHRAVDLARLAGSLVLAASLCFLITQGSFYWLGGRVPSPTLAGWWANFTDWYGHFLAIACVYVAIAALLHGVVVRRAHVATPVPAP